MSLESQRLISASRLLISRSKDAVQLARSVVTPVVHMVTGSATPPCPKCHRMDHVEAEEQFGQLVHLQPVRNAVHVAVASLIELKLCW